jgi:cell cycle checkpoint control protein RAD9A
MGCCSSPLTFTSGVTKTYKLTYESIEGIHALFDKGSASSEWTIRSGFLREFTDFFSPKAEQLDIHCEEGKVTFLGFTDKVINAKHGMTGHHKCQRAC